MSRCIPVETRDGVRLCAALLAGCAALTNAPFAIAQSPDEATPPLTVSRFDENWAAYCDVSPEDAAPLKCITLSGVTISLGLDARLRFEIYDPTSFGRGPQDDNGYWLARASAHAAIQFSPNWRAFGQVFTADAFDRDGGPRPADRNELDLVQGFVEWRPNGEEDAYVRLGRQEIVFGAGRLFAASEGSNVRRQFDGVRAGMRVGEVTYQAVATGLVQVRPGVFDDSASLDRAVFGAGAVHQTASGSLNALYFIAARRPERVFGAPAAIQDRSTLGGRIVRQSERWFADLELIGQYGDADGLDIAAWALAGEGAFDTAHGEVQLRYALRFSIASGDRDPADSALNGFDPLFPNPTYTGSVPLVSPTNTIALNPRISATWPSSLRLSGDVAVIRRLEDSDSVYAFSGAAIETTSAAGDHVGALWSLSIGRQLSPQWSAAATASYFSAGDYFTGVDEADTRFFTINFSFAY